MLSRHHAPVRVARTVVSRPVLDSARSWPHVFLLPAIDAAPLAASLSEGILVSPCTRSEPHECTLARVLRAQRMESTALCSAFAALAGIIHASAKIWRNSDKGKELRLAYVTHRALKPDAQAKECAAT